MRPESALWSFLTIQTRQGPTLSPPTSGQERKVFKDIGNYQRLYMVIFVSVKNLKRKEKVTIGRGGMGKDA